MKKKDERFEEDFIKFKKETQIEINVCDKET